MSRRPISLSPQLCDKCMRCARVCPQRAINVSSAFTFIDWDRCDGCGDCAKACLTGAISVTGSRDAKAEIVERLTTDLAARKATQKAGAETKVAKRAAAAVAGAPAANAPAARQPLARTPFTARWEGWEVAVVLLGVAGLYGLQLAVLGSAWWSKVVPVGAKPLMRAGILTLYYAAQLGLLAALGYRKRAGIAEAFGLKRTSLLHSAAGVAPLVLASEAFVIVYGMVTDRVGWQMPPGPTTNLGAYFGRDSLGLAMTVVMVVIVGPFFEEVVFRGVLLGYLQERTGTWPAIVLSSLLFSSYHLSLWELLPVAAMGVAAGWLAVRRQSLWPAYALHLAFNAVPVFLTFALAR
jgi:membrane protease YdiL (CAAX protease family)/ferredoxin